jgi:hypothetical protein
VDPRDNSYHPKAPFAGPCGGPAIGKKEDVCEGTPLVRCLGQKALDDKVSVDDFFETETAFLANTEPWRGVDPLLLGVPNLRSKLKELQVQMIEASVPAIRKEITLRRDQAGTRVPMQGGGDPTRKE